ncbi:MAG TPA: hypothetical protein VFA60_14795 [Terriglobales bacterium]|nr:hypothetical protein [Terriglobales bacterium]
MARHRVFNLVFVALSVLPLHAADVVRAVMIREATIYLSPDATSSKLGPVGRGREIVILEQGNPGWLHVMANQEAERQVTGWIQDRGVIRTTMPNGDRILFGEAVDSEAEAQKRRGRRGAAEDALRLYDRTAEYFPNSPLAGEAMWRGADIRWQLELADARTRPSARAADPLMKPQIDEEHLRQVQKKFKGTKWADLAAFDLIDNKTCGDWNGMSKCPDREASIYEDYAKDHPQSPKVAEALYEAARRRAALIEIYKTENQPGKSAESRTRAIALLQRIMAEAAQSDWSPRAEALLYKVQQNIPTYGNTND